MAYAPTREEILLMAKFAGLDLPAEFHDDLMHAHARLQEMLERLPRDRDRGDEPAHIFDPLRFMP
jgi:hypothetical protein